MNSCADTFTTLKRVITAHSLQMLEEGQAKPIPDTYHDLFLVVVMFYLLFTVLSSPLLPWDCFDKYGIYLDLSWVEIEGGTEPQARNQLK